MTTASHSVRRAVVDDRDALVSLWQTMRLPAADLEKRLTEFQVVVDEQDRVVGAIGVRFSGKQGFIHSEAHADFAQADRLRTLIWPRLESLAANHGLVRWWTNETAPFWSHMGLSAPSPEEKEKLPRDWSSEGPQWLTLKLREDVEETLTLDQEFAVFMQAEKERSRQMMGHAKALKLVATLLAVILFAGVIAIVIWMVAKDPGLLRR